jgi:outer membrane protein assembly factor BamA
LRNAVFILGLALFLTPSLTSGQEQEYFMYLQHEQELPESIQKNYHLIPGDSISLLGKITQLHHDLLARGYLAASIDTFYFSADTLKVNLYPGKPYYLGKVDYNSLDQKIREQFTDSKPLKQEGIFPLAKLMELKENILTAFENSGYPFASVNFEPVHFEDSIIHLHINTFKNDYYFIDSILIKGEAKISPSYVYRSIQIQPGDAFNQKRIHAIDRQIRNLSFLSVIKPTEVEFKEKSADLYLYLKKQPANTFHGIIGFYPENETTGKLLITGDLNLNLVNSFGRGEELSLQWEKLESSTQKLNLGLGYPYLFNTNLGVDADFELYKKDTLYLSLHTGIGLQLFLDGEKSLRGYYRYKNSSRIGNSQPGINPNLADIQSNLFGLSFRWMHLDYPFNPRKGVSLNIFGGAGFKNINNLQNIADSLQTNPENQWIELDAGLDFDIYHPVYQQFIFHFSNTTRYLDQLSGGDQEALFFENELYRFGGTRSLRGFDENMLSASIYSIQNIELRYLFEQNSAFYLFWNGAYYYKNVIREVTEDFPWGVGIGADFETRAGIFTISYALGKQFDNPLEIRSAKIHFGYVSRF